MKGMRGGRWWGGSVAAIVAALGVAACSSSGSASSGGGDACASCSLACSCAAAGETCDALHAMSDACARTRMVDAPNDPDAWRGSRAEGCGYVSYQFGNGIGAWAYHYDLATGELVGRELYSDVAQGVPCEDLSFGSHASYGVVPDWASCPQKIVCGPAFGGGDSICDWAALCGP